MADPALAQLRKICLALPDAHEVPAWGTSTFRTVKIFAMYAMPSDEKHGKGRPGVWLAAAPGNQSLMIRDRPERFFRPPYVGSSGWIGVWLDKRPAWTEVAALVEDSWRLTGKKRSEDRGKGIEGREGKKRKAGRSPAKRAANKK